jgi:hypothetical protein
MKTSAPPFLRRSFSCAATVVLVAVLTACTATGGGQLAPTAGFTGPASFGFAFSCERSSRSTSLNPPAGQLRTQLSYTEHGTYLPFGLPFTIHGIVDEIDPILESAFCIGQNPPPGGNELIFLGRYRQVSGSAGIIPSTCPTRETSTSPLCRFEVIVQDNDRNMAPSTADSFAIKLSTVTAPCPSDPFDLTCSQLPPPSVFYARAGHLAGGNLTVD